MGKYDALFEEDQPAPAAGGKYSALFEEDPPAEKPGMLSRMGSAAMDMGLSTVSVVGETLDRVSPIMGAPMRAAIGEVQEAREARGGRAEGLGKFLDPEEYKDIGRFGSSFVRNFGRDPEKAPTPGETMESYGVPNTPLSDVLPSFYSETGEGAKLKRGGLLDPTASGTAGMAASIASPVPGLNTAATGIKMGVKGTAKGASMAATGAAAVVDAATGTKVAGKTVGGVKGAIKALGDSWDGAKEGLKATFGAKQADDYGKSLETAMKNGIDPKLLPESVEFGPNSIVTRSARVQAEGPLGQPMLEKFEQAKDQVRQAIHKDVTKIGGGQLPTPVQAGEILREGFNAGVDQAFADVATSHRQIIQQAPDLRLTQNQIASVAPKLQRMEEWAKAKAANGLTKTAKEQGRQIQNAIDAFRRKGESYAGAYEALQEIGDVAFKSKNSMADIAPDVQRFRQLYGDINDALIGTVEESFDAGAAQALRDSNKAMSKIFGDKGLLGKLGEKSASGEDLFQSVVKNGSDKEIRALKEYLAPEQLQAVKATFLHDMLKLDPQGNFTFRSSFNRLRDNWDAADALFEPGELDNYLDLLRLGDKFGNAVMSTSGTGASGAFGEFLKTSKNRLIDDPIAANRKTKARAIGFDIEELPGRAAAKRPGPGPTMGFGPGSRFSGLPDFNPRMKAARAYSIYDEEDEE